MYKQYRDLVENEFIVVGCDTSAGGLDFSTAQFLSKTNLDVPLVYHSQKTTTYMTDELLPVLEEISDKTGIPPVIAYERNNGGSFELERLARLNKYNKFRLYAPEMPNATFNPAKPMKYGWTTSSATRPTMLQDLKEALDNMLIRIYDRETVEELFAFIVNQTSSGWKAQAEDGAHDDCFVAGTPILTDKGQVPIESIKQGDLVMTREGYKPVVMTRCRLKRVITRFGMTGTPDHPFITKNRGEVSFTKLRDNDILYTWNEKQSCIEEKTITDIQSQREDNTESTIGDTIKIKNRPSRSTVRFGLTIMGKYLRDVLSTIKMGIIRIIRLIIWNFSLEANTQNSTWDQRKGGSYPEKLEKSTPADLLKIYESGEKIIPKRQAKFTGVPVKRTGLKMSRHCVNGGKKILTNLRILLRKIRNIFFMTFLDRQHVSSAGSPLLTPAKEGGSTAPESVLTEPPTSEEKSDYRPVYNLQVAEKHEYFANNVLVHNCVMSLAIAWQLYQYEDSPARGSISAKGIVSQNKKFLNKWKL